MTKRRTQIAALLTHWLLAVVGATTFADGDGPTRAMNPSEEAAYDAVRKGVRGSLSAPFPNYASKFTGFDGKPEIFEATKPDGMHRMAFSVAYTVSSFESTDGCLDAGRYCVTVLVGPFEKAGKAGPVTLHGPKAAALGVPTKARALALIVGGPKDNPGLVQDLLATIDLKSLDALVP